MKMWRQGDILIIEDAKIPHSAKPTADKVLVYGEATGHAHRVVSDTATVLDVPDGKMVHAPDGFSVAHEEHATIEIPEGTYRIIRQREYDEETIRYVAD